MEHIQDEKVIDRVATGHLLRKLRGNRTQDEIAAIMGVKKQYLSRIENGREDFTEKVMSRVRKAYEGFEPLTITINGNHMIVNGNQATAQNTEMFEQAKTLMEAAKSTLDLANKTQENANRAMEQALRLLEVSNR